MLTLDDIFEHIIGVEIAENDDIASQLALVGAPCLRIISSSFLIAAFCIIIMSMFQALGNGFYSMICSITRQLVVLLPAAYLLSLTKNLNLVWLSFLIAEIVAIILSAFLFNMTINNSEDYWTIKVNSDRSGKTYFCRTHPLKIGDDSSWISPILNASCLFKSQDSCEKYIKEREKCGFNKANIYTIYNKQGEKYGEYICN